MKHTHTPPADEFELYIGILFHNMLFKIVSGCVVDTSLPDIRWLFPTLWSCRPSSLICAVNKAGWVWEAVLDVQHCVVGYFTATASRVLSQCVQYHHASKFTTRFQHFPFIVLYCHGDTHWSWQIILFIIEYYVWRSVKGFISSPACQRGGIWADIIAGV